MVAVRTKLQVKEQRSLAGNLVYKAATHTDGDIEVLNIRRLHTRRQVSTTADSQTVARASLKASQSHSGQVAEQDVFRLNRRMNSETDDDGACPRVNEFVDF